MKKLMPFVAGVGTMNYSKFITYNVVGGVLWVTLFTLMGFFFGNMPFIQKNFHYAVFAIIGLSIIPIIYEYIQHKRNPNVRGIPTKRLHKLTD